jgi:hypothetical protein
VTGSARRKGAGFLNGIVGRVEKLDTGDAAASVRHSSNHHHLP